MAVETLRRSGQYKITRNIKIHLGLSEMRAALLWAYRYKIEELPQFLRTGKRRIEDKVINTIIQEGLEHIGYWGDQFSLSETEELTQTVDAALRRYWPKL